VLLADGNVGIGGDPAALLRRCARLLAPDGRLHVEAAAPGSRSWAGRVSLRAHVEGAATPARTVPFRWAAVAADDLAGLAGAAALRVVSNWTEAGRWFVSLARR
jgi:hypothetical protein